MNITLTDKNGVILRTAKKHCKEDIHVNIDAKQITINPSTEQQIQNGLFEEVVVSPVTSSIDENIKSEHIIEGIEILGVNGGFKGVDSSNATATAKDMLRNKTAYINNKEVQGEIETYNGDYSGEVAVGNEWEEILKSCIDTTYGANITKLPKGITAIRNYAFNYCSNLALTELPETITSIGNYSFNNCANLSLTKLPAGLTNIGNNAFDTCRSIKITEVPEGITDLKSYAFSGCTSIISLKILGNITGFGNYCLNGCNALEKIELPNITSVPTLGTNSLKGTKIVGTIGYIYVPDDLVESFKVATRWVDYAEQIKPISELEV